MPRSHPLTQPVTLAVVYAYEADALAFHPQKDHFVEFALAVNYILEVVTSTSTSSFNTTSSTMKTPVE